MELKESVMMDITDAFHGEDIKTDFFDFVVSSAAAAAAAAAAASENNNNNHHNHNHHHNHHQEDDGNQHHNNNNHHQQHLQQMQQFAKQMRTVNAFLEGADHHNNNNHHHHHEVIVKQEPNNNNDSTMLMSEVATATAAGSPQNVTNFDASFWSDKETVRIETAILEDLNRYWSSEEANGGDGGGGGGGVGVVEIGSPSRNGVSGVVADGQIYTLTVLNGIDQSATWYRPPKEEDVSVSSPGSMEHLHGAGLDIDSILNIMPGQMGAYNNNFGDATMSPSNTDGLIKSETCTFEDSGFANDKDELTSTLIIDTPLLEAHDSFNNNNNNNNDWKLTNNNTTASATAADDGSPDSLLRSALQGKTYGVRYNGGPKASKGESNTELRRVLSTPPGKTDAVYLKEEQADHIPTIVAGIDANGKVVFEEHVSPRLSQDGAENNNPSSTHSVDDLLLSQLDHPFPEDFEKLKRIANEVAESVSQYCQIDASGESSSISPIGGNQIGILYSLTSPIQIATPVAAAAAAASSSSSSKPPKKYKRQTSASKSSNQSNVQTATSTSNGVRKERSLHYCSICSKGFKDKYSVNVHIRTHTGEKPFACSLCGKSFRQKAHLAKHYQTHIAQKNAAAAGAGGAGGGGGTIAATAAASKAKSR